MGKIGTGDVRVTNMGTGFDSTVNGRSYHFHGYLKINEATQRVMCDKSIKTSNGCGAGMVSRFLVSILESYYKISLIKCCIIHDIAYETADRTTEAKIQIDSDFHSNCFLTAMDLGLKASKARTVSRLFHAAVFMAGKDSYSYKND